MELKEQKEKFLRPIEAKDLETVEIALTGAIEHEAMTAKEAADVRKTIDLVKNGTNDDVINQIIVLTLLLKAPELKAIQFAIGKHVEKLEMLAMGTVLKKLLKGRGIKDIKDIPDMDIEEVLKNIEA
mgnify:FL=1